MSEGDQTFSKAPTSSKQERVNIVLPAGGRISGEFAQTAGVEIKTLIRLNGTTILRRTLEVLRETGRAERIVVIGPEEALAEAREGGADATLPEGATGPENIFHGIEWAGRQGGRAERLLIATTDLPFLTAEAITAFLDACPPEADIAVPIISKEAFERQYPGSVNTYTPLRDGLVTPGCVFLVNPETLRRNQHHIESMFVSRKSELAMARRIGLPFILRYLTRRLTIAHIEKRCQEILGCVGVAVRNAPPELAFDIDLPVEYEYARAQAAIQKVSTR